MVNDHLTPCFPVSSRLKPLVHLLQSTRTCTHTRSPTQPLAKLSGSDFSLRISHQIWTAGCRFLQGKFGKRICKPQRKHRVNKVEKLSELP